MKRIAKATALAVFIGAAALTGAAQEAGSRRAPARPKDAPAGQAKAPERQPVASAQSTPNCSGRPGARCAKKGGGKRLRTIF